MTDLRRVPDDIADRVVEVRERQRAPRDPGTPQAGSTPTRVPEEGRSPVSKGPVATLFADLGGVVGVGIDVVGIAAFAEQLEQPGTRFAQAFTPHERRAARSGEGSEAESLAARWAAKEAVVKAWSSTRFGQEEVVDPAHVDLREIEVRTDAWGRPAIRLHGEIARSMAGYAVQVSLTHDESADVAAAVVVLQGEHEAGASYPPAREGL